MTLYERIESLRKSKKFLKEILKYCQLYFNLYLDYFQRILQYRPAAYQESRITVPGF